MSLDPVARTGLKVIAGFAAAALFVGIVIGCLLGGFLFGVMYG